MISSSRPCCKFLKKRSCSWPGDWWLLERVSIAWSASDGNGSNPSIALLACFLGVNVGLICSTTYHQYSAFLWEDEGYTTISLHQCQNSAACTSVWISPDPWLVRPSNHHSRTLPLIPNLIHQSWAPFLLQCHVEGPLPISRCILWYFDHDSWALCLVSWSTLRTLRPRTSRQLGQLVLPSLRYWFQF